MHFYCNCFSQVLSVCGTTMSHMEMVGKQNRHKAPLQIKLLFNIYISGFWSNGTVLFQEPMAGGVVNWC